MKKRNINLKSKIEIQEIFRKGKFIKINGLKILYKSNFLADSRILVTFSKRFKGSVKRNHIKRILRESFIKILKISKEINIDIIVVVYSSKLRLTYLNAEIMMKSLFL